MAGLKDARIIAIIARRTQPKRQKEDHTMRLFGVRIAVALAVGVLLVVCGTASASSVWFSGYLNPSNEYRYYAFTDWDTPLFGVGILPDTSVLGVTSPSYRVDGHVVFEADGTGNCTVIESTGSDASSIFAVGAVFPVSVQFAYWNSSPGLPVVIDTRGDHDANFLNIVAGSVPEPASLSLMAVCGGFLLVRRRRSGGH